MARDFHYRLAVLLVLTLAFCILIGSVALLPSYFLSSVKKNFISAKLEGQSHEPVPKYDTQSLALVKDLNSKLGVVETSEKNKFLPSLKVINAILLHKRSDIKITQILYENNAAQGKKISINGAAPSREVLLLFRQALEDSGNFKNVDLPISNFVKGSNIQFYLNLMPV